MALVGGVIKSDARRQVVVRRRCCTGRRGRDGSRFVSYVTKGRGGRSEMAQAGPSEPSNLTIKL